MAISTRYRAVTMRRSQQRIPFWVAAGVAAMTLGLLLSIVTHANHASAQAYSSTPVPVTASLGIENGAGFPYLALPAKKATGKARRFVARMRVTNDSGSAGPSTPRTDLHDIQLVLGFPGFNIDKDPVAGIKVGPDRHSAVWTVAELPAGTSLPVALRGEIEAGESSTFTMASVGTQTTEVRSTVILKPATNAIVLSKPKGPLRPGKRTFHGTIGAATCDAPGRVRLWFRYPDRSLQGSYPAKVDKKPITTKRDGKETPVCRVTATVRFYSRFLKPFRNEFYKFWIRSARLGDSKKVPVRVAVRL